ncbi:molybdopterin-dependent oxidoreductase [Bacillus paranthracis]
MALVDSNANHVHEVLSSLDFFVVQDVFLSKTAQYADVVLPAAPSLEKRRYVHKYRASCSKTISKFFLRLEMRSQTGGLCRKLRIN